MEKERQRDKGGEVCVFGERGGGVGGHAVTWGAGWRWRAPAGRGWGGGGGRETRPRAEEEPGVISVSAKDQSSSVVVWDKELESIPGLVGVHCSCGE